MSKKGPLGRGLGALINDNSTYEQPTNNNINEVDIESVKTNPFQPRKEFEPESITELCESIQKLGLIQPITVRRIDDKNYQLISGERRLRACKEAGLTKVTAYIRESDDQGMLEMALVENIQRIELNPMEIAFSLQSLIDECALTQETVSERIGKKRSTVANYLRLLRLPDQVQVGLKKELISMGHAKVLMGIEDKDILIKIYLKVTEENLSIKELERLLKGLNSDKKEYKGRSHLPENYTQWSKKLSTNFSTKIQLKRSEKGDGKIVIPFQSDEDFERIAEIFKRLDL